MFPHELLKRLSECLSWFGTFGDNDKGFDDFGSGLIGHTNYGRQLHSRAFE